jgi:hypothetical protein
MGDGVAIFIKRGIEYCELPNSRDEDVDWLLTSFVAPRNTVLLTFIVHLNVIRKDVRTSRNYCVTLKTYVL